MKYIYSAASGLAIMLLTALSAPAQVNPTALNASRRSLFDIKKHDAASHVAPPADQRGGGLVNDECDAAIEMTVGTECVPSAFSLDGATQSIDPTTCSTYLSTAANDLWFYFVATSDVTVIEVTGGGDATTGLDAVLGVYNPPCSDLVFINCIDASVRGETEQIALVTVTGTTYYYRAYYYAYVAAQTVFDFTTCVYSPTTTPTNDQCSGAVGQALSVGTPITFTGDNTGALDTEGLGYSSVWESFTTTECSFITLDYCGTTPAFGNAFLSLFMGCPYTGTIPSTAFDTTTCGDQNFTLQFEYVPAGTFYFPVLSDTGSVGPYTINASAVACPAGYCGASSEQCDEYLAEVIIGTIDNTSDCAVGPVVDYTALSTTIAQGASLSITVLNGPATYMEDQVTAWVDWNNNENFYDAGESFTLTSTDDGATFTGSITAPIDAVLGTVRMRIRMMYTGSPAPCGSAAYGEVEDYSLNVELPEGVVANSMDGFLVSPNPTDGDLVVSTSYAMNAMAEVLDVTGRLLHSGPMTGTQAHLGLAGKLAPGTYLLRLRDASGSTEHRFVVR